MKLIEEHIINSGSTVIVVSDLIKWIKSYSKNTIFYLSEYKNKNSFNDFEIIGGMAYLWEHHSDFVELLFYEKISGELVPINTLTYRYLKENDDKIFIRFRKK